MIQGEWGQYEVKNVWILASKFILVKQNKFNTFYSFCWNIHERWKENTYYKLSPILKYLIGLAEFDLKIEALWNRVKLNESTQRFIFRRQNELSYYTWATWVNYD